jgi:putative tryptophan/tyrosine transport system substrate-binding protein
MLIETEGLARHYQMGDESVAAVADVSLSVDAGEFVGIALLKEILPGAARVAYLGTNEDWEGPSGKIVRATAQVLGLTVVLAAHTPTEYADAFNLLGRVSVDALFVSAGLYQVGNRRLIVDFARQSRLPDTYAFGEAVELGALMSYGADSRDLVRRSAGSSK